MHRFQEWQDLGALMVSSDGSFWDRPPGPSAGSHSRISRMKHGRVGFKERDAAALAREASTPGWRHAYSDVLPAWAEPYVGLEAAASVIRTYQIQLVPGLLQTEGYARALIRRGPRAPRLWAVVDEGALCRPVSDRQIARGQLKHLAEMADHPAVTLQILPFRIGAHAAMSGPFTILRFAEPDLADVVYIEQLTSGLYLDKPAEVDSYLAAMEQLCMQAEPAASTPEILQRILADI